jgi:hypothetical protein
MTKNNILIFIYIIISAVIGILSAVLLAGFIGMQSAGADYFSFLLLCFICTLIVYLFLAPVFFRLLE